MLASTGEEGTQVIYDPGQNYERLWVESAFWLLFVTVKLAGAVLAHGALHAPAGDEKHGAPADVHALVGDAFEVVHRERGSDPPLGVAGLLLARVHRQVHRLRVEQVDPVVGSLQGQSAIHIAVLKDVQALPKEVSGGAGHLGESAPEVGVTLATGGLDN